ncbi:MAG: heavy metal-associated domain-containing protein [Methanosarcina sp.]
MVKVDWLLHPADALAVEKHLHMHAGIRRIEVSLVSGVTIVEYDESLITVKEIQRIVAERGYHCRVFRPQDIGGEHET